MRRSMMTVVGISAAAAALAVSRLSDGLLGAAAFMLALFIGAITLGLLAAAGVDRLTARSERIADGVPDHVSRLLAFRSDAHSSTPCRSCGESMVPAGSLWVCGTCDLAGIRA